jgi:hypothetical protein
MPVWRTQPVEEQGSLTLRSWKIVELPDGDRHLVGYCVENLEGRVSSAVRTFDPQALRGVTGTGRVYTLRGRPGVNADAEYVWNRWLGLNAQSVWIDVTASVWHEHISKQKGDQGPEPALRKRRRPPMSA